MNFAFEEHGALKGRCTTTGLHYSPLGPCYICMASGEHSCDNIRDVTLPLVLPLGASVNGEVCAAHLFRQDSSARALARSIHSASSSGRERIAASAMMTPRQFRQQEAVLTQRAVTEHRLKNTMQKHVSGSDVMRKNITTLMMQGLPNTAGTPSVTSWLCQLNFLDHVDVVYTPYDVKTETNSGFAFINLTSVEAAAALVDLAKGTYFEGSDQKLQFLIADIQGSEAVVRQIAQRKLHRIRNPQLRPYIAKCLFKSHWMHDVNAPRDVLWRCTHLMGK
mmetsp:Transcript_7702/g.16935  ORF Transcript_7702/g.16935 Transcript_7702/m.16935 type:complete len:278 (+) Transcript_7702:197-1030(+)